MVDGDGIISKVSLVVLGGVLQVLLVTLDNIKMVIVNLPVFIGDFEPLGVYFGMVDFVDSLNGIDW